MQFTPSHYLLFSVSSNASRLCMIITRIIFSRIFSWFKNDNVNVRDNDKQHHRYKIAFCTTAKRGTVRYLGTKSEYWYLVHQPVKGLRDNGNSGADPDGSSGVCNPLFFNRLGLIL